MGKKKLSANQKRWNEAKPSDFVIKGGEIKSKDDLVLLELIAIQPVHRHAFARDWSLGGKIRGINSFYTISEIEKRFGIKIQLPDGLVKTKASELQPVDSLEKAGYSYVKDIEGDNLPKEKSPNPEWRKGVQK